MSLATCALLFLSAGPTETENEAQSSTHEVSTLHEKKDVRVPLHQHPTLLSMLEKNNELRRRMGLRPQRINPLLTRAAQNHAVYMARTGSFSHYSNRGPFGRARRFGFGGNVRENIALGQGTVFSAFRSWRNSSGHWASIISDAPEVGFGYARSSSGSPFWVAVYGYPTEEDHKKVAAITAELRTEADDASDASLQEELSEINSATGESSGGDSPNNQPMVEMQPSNASEGSATHAPKPTSGGSNHSPYRRRGIFRRLFR